jgi:hypothetical protein
MRGFNRFEGVEYTSELHHALVASPDRAWGRTSSSADPVVGYRLMTTKYARRLYRGRGYRYRKPWRLRVTGSAVLMLKVAAFLALSFALTAQAHGVGSDIACVCTAPQ